MNLNDNDLVLYGNPTPSDLQFLHDNPFSFPSTTSSFSSTLSSTRSNAVSAPPELDRLFNSICEKYTELVQLSNIQLPQEWSIPDLIRAIMGNESVIIPGYLESTYYDLFLRGNNSWLFEDLRDFINLINYAPPVWSGWDGWKDIVFTAFFPYLTLITEGPR